MIRFATEADVPVILDIYSPYIENTTISFEYTIPSLEEFTRRFRSVTEQFPWLVWEEEGEILGYAYGSLPFSRAAYQWCASASVYLRPEAQGRGIGKALYTALEKWLTLQGYHKVYAIITDGNQDSLEFHMATGYQTVARFPRCGYKFGQWLGVTWMEKPLKKGQNPESVPLSIGSVVNPHRKSL